MATTSVQNESAQAKPLSLWDVERRLDDIESRVDELAALIYTVSRDDQLDPEVRTALRGLGKIAATVGADLIEVTADLPNVVCSQDLNKV